MGKVALKQAHPKDLSVSTSRYITMLYLSQLLGAPVEDLQGERVGRIQDILIPRNEPNSTGVLLIEGQEGQFWRVPPEEVEWHGNVLRWRTREPIVQRAIPSPQEVSLAQEVIDKQVIDLTRKKAVRVNDVSLTDDWRVAGIDNSTLGLVRRLAPSWLLGANSKRSPMHLIPWDRVELIGLQTPDEELESEGGLRSPGTSSAPVTAPLETPHQPAPSLQMEAGKNTGVTPGEEGTHEAVSRSQLAELRPADIADIVHQLTPGQGARLLEGLDDETAADALEEIDTERQRHILENIRADRAADILEAMGPDEAADLLATLPEEHAQELLRLMTPEESEDVQELLEYEEDTAGGLMTTDYIALNTTKSVAEALEAVRSTLQEQDVRAAYVYCVSDETQDECTLQGVVSVWDLLVAAPTQTLQELMATDLITVQPDTDPQTVAEIMAKYNLLAVPVVSKEGFIEGIVTVDDALDVLLPNERRRKPTRMY